MAVIALPVAVSSAIAGTSIAGTALATAAVAAGTAVGGFIDTAIVNAIAGPVKSQVTGPRINTNRIQNSTEGAAIPKNYGRNRLAGQLIWAARLLEVEDTTTQTTGGKGGGRKQQTTSTNYTYFGSFAVGLCEGPIKSIGRIWADGKLLDITDYTVRVYKGTEVQTVDAKISAVEGADFAPAFRGLAYVVFESLDLSDFGNRIPQLNFEVFSAADNSATELEQRIPGVNIIPGASEYAYGTTIVTADPIAPGITGTGWDVTDASETNTKNEINRHTESADTDWTVSIDDLEVNIPNIETTSLVISWMGTDLRMSDCLIEPRVEQNLKILEDTADDWFVSGVDRLTANETSSDVDGPLLGGTPSDKTVHQALTDLKARGHKVVFYPFIMMDIDDTNTLPDPYSDNAAGVGQPAFPWRGRIVPSPAPGFAGSPDKTAGVTTQVNSFFGTAAPGDFGSWSGTTIPYTGPAEFSFRRFILHYAKLCAEVGGIDTFIIGSEMVQMTTARDSATNYPSVAKLVTLAADVSTILGAGVNVTYAADWSEYHSHRPTDASNDVFFHLDPLWSDSNIDFIAIDNYLPTTDWRNTPSHLDLALYDYIYDLAYHQANIEGGEYYDWFYASASDRSDQTRTTITDGLGKPWVFGNKDIKNWWLNLHYNRPGGVEDGSPTSWAVESKPIVFTELGCPAVDKGSNQPNVFIDPKSSESFFPYFSNGARDDYIQRIYIEAWIDYWDPPSGNNPTSAVYADDMIDMSRLALWTWDARPHPTFPNRDDVWRDGDNWRLGHWITGRLGQVTLPSLVRAITEDLGVTVNVDNLYGLVGGYLIDNIMSARQALGSLSVIYSFDAYESDGEIKFRHRGGATNWTLGEASLVPVKSDASTYLQLRAQEIDLPDQSLLTFIDESSDYQQAVVQAKRLIGNSMRVASSVTPAVLSREKAQQAADLTLMDAWLSRERVSCVLPPNLLAADVTDIIMLTLDSVENEYRIENINYEYKRTASLVKTDRSLYNAVTTATVSTAEADVKNIVSSAIDFVELPLTSDTGNAVSPWLALFTAPWQAISVFYSAIVGDFILDVNVETASAVGTLTLALSPGPEDTWDMGNTITVQMGTDNLLESKDELSVLNGANSAAIKADNDEWEVIQWVTATLIGSNKFELTQLLRSRLGTEQAMNGTISLGAQFVLLPQLTQSSVGTQLREVTLNWKFGPRTRGLSDPSYRTVQYAPKAIGLRPYSPVFLEATKPVDDIITTWIRRTRLPEAGDSWASVEVPLGEETENYEIDIYDAAGTTLLRTLTSTSETVTYTLAQQTTDFGSGQTFIDFEVFQMSVIFGRGTGRRIKITGL